jgi:hypothetical protein
MGTSNRKTACCKVRRTSEPGHQQSDSNIHIRMISPINAT